MCVSICMPPWVNQPRERHISHHPSPSRSLIRSRGEQEVSSVIILTCLAALLFRAVRQALHPCALLFRPALARSLCYVSSQRNGVAATQVFLVDFHVDQEQIFPAHMIFWYPMRPPLAVGFVQITSMLYRKIKIDMDCGWIWQENQAS